MAGSEWFSLLDFNEAFLQIEWDSPSRLLNTMATNKSIFYWNRMNMGVSIASELFQEIMTKLVGDIKGVEVAIDDIIIHTPTIEENQHSLTKCLDRIAASGMTLNKDKCVFVAQELDFFGVTINKDGITPKKGNTMIFRTAVNPKTPKTSTVFWVSWILQESLAIPVVDRQTLASSFKKKHNF